MNTVNPAIDWHEVVHKIANARDEAAFKELFNTFYEPLLRFSVAITDDRESSEDVLSDLMMMVWISSGKLLGVRNLKTYLFISVKNRSLNILEREKTKTAYLNTLTVRSSGVWTPEDELLGKDLSRQLDLAISELPPKTKMAFLLIRDNECSYAEAAEIMEISTKTVDRHIQIALTKIRASINY